MSNNVAASAAGTNVQQSGATPQVVLQYGIYRDGDNNLDQAEGPLIPQAVQVSAKHSNISMLVMDTTSYFDGHPSQNGPRTYTYELYNGKISNLTIHPRQDMSKSGNLAEFIADNYAEAHAIEKAHPGVKVETAIEIIDHGAGDAGAVFVEEPDGTISHMTADDMAAAVRRGAQIHAQRDPSDHARNIEYLDMHVCFSNAMGVINSMSDAGVHYFIGTEETAIAPGTPTTVAADIADNILDPTLMGNAVVEDVLKTRYHAHGLTYGPVAAIDVLDIAPDKMRAAADAERQFNALAIEEIRQDPRVAHRLINDARKIPGMQRDDPAAAVPWRADRPAIALYLEFESDPKLPAGLRAAAHNVAVRIAQLIVAHGETHNAVGFGSDYRDVIGPTTRFPVSYAQVDPLQDQIVERNAAYENWSLQNALISIVLATNQRYAAATA